MRSSKLKFSTSQFIWYAMDLVFIVITLILQLYNEDDVIWTIVGVLIFNCIFAMKKRERLPFLLFNITFFTFLLSRLVVLRIDGTTLLAEYSTYTKEHVFFYLIIGLITITIGQILYERMHKTRERLLIQADFLCEEKWKLKNANLLFVILALYYITYPLSFLDIMDKAIFVGTHSYSSYYTEYSSRLPYILAKIGSLNRIAFVLLLCVEHRRKKLLLPSILYGVTAIISLGIGQRNIFVLDVLMFIVLIGYANAESIRYTGEQLYSKRLVITVFSIIPFMIIFLGYWKYARAGIPFEMGDIYNYFRDFFYSQGEQIGFFANTVEFKAQIWEQTVPYTFSAPYNYFRNLFGLIDYGIYTAENAYFGNSLAATQFYITSPGSLIRGSGSGCCYLSELYFDFGVFGIVIGSLIIGYVLGGLQIRVGRSFYINALVALMIRSIIYIPRASYFDWIATPFNIWNVAIIIVVIAVVNILNKRHGMVMK